MDLKELRDRYTRSGSFLSFDAWVGAIWPNYVKLLSGPALAESVEGARKPASVALKAGRPEADEAGESALENTRETSTSDSPARQTPQQKWRAKNKVRLAEYQKQWRKKKNGMGKS